MAYRSVCVQCMWLTAHLKITRRPYGDLPWSIIKGAKLEIWSSELGYL